MSLCPIHNLLMPCFECGSAPNAATAHDKRPSELTWNSPELQAISGRMFAEENGPKEATVAQEYRIMADRAQRGLDPVSTTAATSALPVEGNATQTHERPFPPAKAEPSEARPPAAAHSERLCVHLNAVQKALNEAQSQHEQSVYCAGEIIDAIQTTSALPQNLGVDWAKPGSDRTVDRNLLTGEITEWPASAPMAEKGDLSRKDAGFDLWRNSKFPACVINRTGSDHELWYSEGQLRDAWIAGAATALQRLSECERDAGRLLDVAKVLLWHAHWAIPKIEDVPVAEVKSFLALRSEIMEWLVASGHGTGIDFSAAKKTLEEFRAALAGWKGKA